MIKAARQMLDGSGQAMLQVPPFFWILEKMTTGSTTRKDSAQIVPFMILAT